MYTNGEEVDYFPVDREENPCLWPRGNPKRVNAAMRSEVTLLYLDLDRQAEKQLRTNQWTLYGKLLKRIEQEIPGETKAQFARDVADAIDTHLRGSISQAQKVIASFLRRQTDLDVRLDFSLVEPIEVLRAVRPIVVEGEIRSDAEELGAGAQSALAVAIAKAYADIVRQPMILAIEEPELYLHPHGCRHFDKLLRHLSQNDNLQIIYATHERSFVNAGDFADIHIVRKPTKKTEVTSGNGIVARANSRERLRIQSRFNERLNEVFFASSVVLVEADPDEIACRCALEHLGFELDKQSVSVVSLSVSVRATAVLSKAADESYDCK